jgi:phosphoserine aminotransferase
VVRKDWRSRINISFTLPTPEQTSKFLAHCEEKGLMEIHGHRSIGGCRISLYVPVPQIAIDELRDVMQEYMEKNY